ncbi:MAG: hypothetical protein WCE75_01965 [Terracidiphilus sp.]
MLRPALACLALLCASAPAHSQVANKDLPAYLAGVTERGRALYAYDQAAWHGTDAFLDLHPSREGLARYVCVKTLKGWKVVFPKWDTLHAQLLVAYEASDEQTPGHFTARRFDPPIEPIEDLAGMERALEAAIADFGSSDRPYNTAILPAPGGDLYVYLYPGQTRDDVWPIGGDLRYTFSPDGKQILDKRQLHKTILDMRFDPKLQIVAGTHSHILSDVPEDTDVLYVLTRKPSIPEYIAAGKRIFVVETDGSIRLEKK